MKFEVHINFLVYFRGVLCDHEVQPMTNARSQGGHSVPWISGNSQGYQNNFFNFQHQQGKYNKAKKDFMYWCIYIAQNKIYSQHHINIHFRLNNEDCEMTGVYLLNSTKSVKK